MQRLISLSPATRRRSSRDRGFTLIELMITVAIVGILAAIAYPSYTSSVIKGKRSQGRTALLDLLTQQERYFTQHNSYMTFGAGATGNNGIDASGGSLPIVFKTWSGDGAVTAQPAYKLKAEVCSSTLSVRECVKLTAVPQFADAAVNELVVTSAGQKSCSGTTASVCWN